MTTNPLLANARPWCVGRFVYDRPAQSGLSAETYEFCGDHIEVTENVTPGTFRYKVSARENELRSKTREGFLNYKEMLAKGLDSMVVNTDIPWLERSVSPTDISRLFLYKDAVDPEKSFEKEGFVLVGSTLLHMTTPYRVGHQDMGPSVALATDIYRHISYREDWTLPTEPGFCIPGALIGGPSRNSEAVVQGIVLKPGVPTGFLIDMRDAVDSDQQSSLLDGLSDLRRELHEQGYSDHVRILRKGKRQVGGMAAEEVLFSIKQDGALIYRFYLLAPGDPKTVAQPHAAIQLCFGEAPSEAGIYGRKAPPEISSPVDETGAIEVWDTLLGSLRLRPGAV